MPKKSAKQVLKEEFSELEPLTERTLILHKEAQKFCVEMGLPKDLMIKIMKTDTDWAFVLKIDALMESAAKEILRKGLQIKLLRQTFRNDDLDDFVDSLPMNGRTSLMKLLRAACLPDDELGFIESVRKVRNAYAHDIRCADMSIIELIKTRGDKSQLLKYLSAIKTYVEDDLMQTLEKDRAFLRFLMMDSTMRVLFYAYHLAVKKS